MSTVKSKNLQVGTDATASNNFTIYQPSTTDGTLRIGVGNADSPTEVGRFNSNGYVATNAPAFNAYLSSSFTSYSSNTWTKAPINTKLFDTTNDYDATNYRFQPSVAGYYQINGCVRFYTAGTLFITSIYKNGSEYQRGGYEVISTDTYVSQANSLVYLNGSTDYVELYFFNTFTTSGGVLNGNTRFSGFLARAA